MAEEFKFRFLEMQKWAQTGLEGSKVGAWIDRKMCAISLSLVVKGIALVSWNVLKQFGSGNIIHYVYKEES